MRVFYCDHYPVVLPPKHRFPMAKYALLRERLVETGLLNREQLVPAPQIEREQLVAVHADEYVDAFLDGTLDAAAVRRLGFPWSPELVARSLASVGGTWAATRAALEDGLAGHLAGGTHHAYREFGSGFCAFNDLAVAARWALDEAGLERVLIFDVDVHQGDGTAALFEGDERVFTCSLHGAKNFPARKQTSDLDVPLPDGTGDDAFLEAMERALEQSLERSDPQLVLFQAGVDALATDRLGRLALSHAGLYERDRRMLARVRSAGLPAVLTLGGGYGEPIEETLAANLGTYRAAREVLEAGTSAGTVAP